VSNENLQNGSEFRKFLLGEMEENERAEFEGQFILDEELFEQLSVAEDELIEEYVRGSLVLTEKSKFEANFLTTEKRRQRVEFTRQMLAQLKGKEAAVAEVKKTAPAAENPSFFESVWAIFKQPGLALVSAFVVLLFVLGGWFLLRNSNQPIDIAKSTSTPTPQISVSPTPLVSENKNIAPNNIPVNSSTPNKNNDSGNQLPKNETNTNKKAENTPQEKTLQPQPNSVITTLALFAGGVRAEGKNNELNLSKNSSGANLQLNLESQDYKNYRAEIVDQNGSVIYRSGILKAQNSKVNAFVSAQKLKRGDYIIKLYGKNAKNEDESVADFQFRVNKK
jgi:hypothetical protein